MNTIPFGGWIANAAAGLTGRCGAITQQAHQTGCSRQSVYDHTHKVLAAVEAQHGGGPTREQLLEENQALRQENAQLWDWLSQTIEFPLAKQQQFAVTALAMGLSLNQTLVLFTILLGAAACPGRSTVHRWGQAAATAAGRVLQRLDRAGRTLVLVGCLDEIFFHHRPILVGVEPHSMVWFIGRKADNCQGTTWFRELQPWNALSLVLCDAGSGLQAGVAALQQDRQVNAGEAVPLAKGLDVFHTQQEARRVLKTLWNRTERTWEQAEAADRAVEQARRQGRDARGPAQAARAAWKKAAAAFQRYEIGEAGWKLVEPALRLFRPDGDLNDRSWAEAQVSAALPLLSGPEWSKVRGLLQTPESFTFLDQVHDHLSRLAVAEELRAALVHLWWLRRQRRRAVDPAGWSGALAAVLLVQKLLCQKLAPDWRESYGLVAAVLSRAVRASSAVECMNSVLRMHQSRHRTVNQGLLDLKRLYWNTRVFRGGKRKGKCAYEHLGLKPADCDFWKLLEGEMTLALSQAKAEAQAKAQAREQSLAA
jgi:hypothetical protein